MKFAMPKRYDNAKQTSKHVEEPAANYASGLKSTIIEVINGVDSSDTPLLKKLWSAVNTVLHTTPRHEASAHDASHTSGSNDFLALCGVWSDENDGEEMEQAIAEARKADYLREIAPFDE